MRLGVRPLAILRHALHELRSARYSGTNGTEGSEAAESMIEAVLVAAGLECNGAMVPGRWCDDGVVPVPEYLEHHGDSCPIHEACSYPDCDDRGERGKWESGSLEDARP